MSGAQYEAQLDGIDLQVAEPEDKDCEYSPPVDPDGPEDGPTCSKRKKRVMTNEVLPCQDPLPIEFRHLRKSVKNVKSEFYRVTDKLISVYHCSYRQAVAAVVETGNILFQRNWKFNADSEVIDVDTAPGDKTLREAGKAILWQTLAEIVDEMMGGDEVVITYHEDGSKKKGCGSFSVQGCTIDGKFRAFPTLKIASESRENLAELKKTILDILSCVSGKYSSKDLFEHITFRVSDSVSHNLGVDDLVALDLGTEHIPDHLLCHAHPVLMFVRKLVETFASIEATIGTSKIFSNMLVDFTNTHDSVTEQYIHCVVNLFSPEINHKSWNRSSDFSSHIAPAKNLAVGFRTERFNRFVYLCAVVIYHDPHIWSFLAKYEHVTNNLACIVRAFEDVEFLRIHCAVGALIGIHLLEPYLSLTTSANVAYFKLIPALKQL